MTDEKPLKSALELAMERLKKKDADAGIESRIRARPSRTKRSFERDAGRKERLEVGEALRLADHGLNRNASSARSLHDAQECHHGDGSRPGLPHLDADALAAGSSRGAELPR